ncbi:hypothetical protein PQG22_09000 [Aquirufa beregesia]
MLFIQEVLSYGNEIIQLALNAMNDCELGNQQALLLLILTRTNNDINKEMTDKFFEEYPRLRSIPPVESVVKYICEDNFKDDVYCNTENIHIWERLSKLKQNMLEYYTQNVCEAKADGLFYEFHSKFYQMNVQLNRLRLVIQPEFHVIKNVHPVSKIPYLSVRGFWIDENDKKVKIFTKSLGREDSYVDGKNDGDMLKEATKQIQHLAYLKYLEAYK